MLSQGSPIYYQESVLLWTALFEEIHDVKHLASVIEDQVKSNDAYVRRAAVHFLATLSNLCKLASISPQHFEEMAQLLLEHKKCTDKFGTTITKQSDLEEIRGIEYEYTARCLLSIKKFFDALMSKPIQINTLSLLGLEAWNSIQDLQLLVQQLDKVIKQIAPRELMYRLRIDQHRQAIPIWSAANTFSAIRVIYTLQALKPTFTQRDLVLHWKQLASIFLSTSLSEVISHHLLNDKGTSTTESLDFLHILLGRIFLLQAGDMRDKSSQREIQKYVSIACHGLTRPQITQEEIAIRLEFVRSLQVSTKSDVEFTIQLAQTFLEDGVLDACAFSLRHAKLHTNEKRDSIELLTRSPLEILHQAAYNMQRSKDASIWDYISR